MLCTDADACPSARMPLCRPKLGRVYILLLLASLCVISTHSRSLGHHIDNRSPEIDPYWYVGRGVRPIGRFGKRQLKNRNILQNRVRSLFELVMHLLNKQNGLNLNAVLKEENW